MFISFCQKHTTYINVKEINIKEVNDTQRISFLKFQDFEQFQHCQTILYVYVLFWLPKYSLKPDHTGDWLKCESSAETGPPAKRTSSPFIPGRLHPLASPKGPALRQGPWGALRGPMAEADGEPETDRTRRVCERSVRIGF